MANLPAIVRATRASAMALKACQRIAREARELEAIGNTAAAVTVYSKLCRAQRRYQRAQAILNSNPI